MKVIETHVQQRRRTAHIAIASLVGTTIEFYDFYIYGTATALVIGPAFFPDASPSSQALNAFLTFGIAFLARPLGSAVFGHFGIASAVKPRSWLRCS
jgi:MFS family permease